MPGMALSDKSRVICKTLPRQVSGCKLSPLRERSGTVIPRKLIAIGSRIFYPQEILRMKKSRFTESQIYQVLKEAETGETSSLEL